MPNTNSRQTTLTIIGVLLIATAFLGGYYVRGENINTGQTSAGVINQSQNAPIDVDLDPFWKAWAVLEQKFVPATTTQDITDEEKLWGAIQGLTRSYNDPYTSFLPPRESEVFQENISGSFGGVGMEIGVRDGTLTVISPLEGTPADRAGLQPGDQILAVDDESTQDMTIDDAVQRIRGEKGTAVTLTIVREEVEQAFDVSVTRGTIDIPTINTTLRQDGVFVIELYNFSAVAADKFRGALREFVAAGTDKLILDLRGNTGGFLSHAIDISSWFLPAGKAVVIEDFGEVQGQRTHRSRGYDIFTDELNFVILVNGGTASASEIVAGALREHGKATLIGTQTFGKGSVQELIDITNETSLKVTVARWLIPGGKSISDGGITPDIVVEMTAEDREAGRDPQLQRAVEYLTSGE